MKNSFLAAAGCALCFTAISVYADSKEYQATGTVTAMTDATITVQKGKELWEIGKGTDTKSTGEAPKVGDKVTVHYSMMATSIENKGAAAAAAKAPKASPSPAAAPAPAVH